MALNINYRNYEHDNHKMGLMAFALMSASIRLAELEFLEKRLTD